MIDPLPKRYLWAFATTDNIELAHKIRDTLTAQRRKVILIIQDGELILTGTKATMLMIDQLWDEASAKRYKLMRRRMQR